MEHPNRMEGWAAVAIKMPAFSSISCLALPLRVRTKHSSGILAGLKAGFRLMRAIDSVQEQLIGLDGKESHAKQLNLL